MKDKKASRPQKLLCTITHSQALRLDWSMKGAIKLSEQLRLLRIYFLN